MTGSSRSLNQFGLGRGCIKSPALKLDVSRLSLLAGKRARTAGAYASALQYFRLGREILPRGSWNSSYELAFDLERSIAECEFVAGELDACEGRLRSLKRRVRTTAEEAEALCLEILVHFTAGRHELAIESGMAFLGANGATLLPDAGDLDVSLEYDRLKRNLEGASIENFGSHPPMIDARHLAAMKVLIGVHPAAATAPSRSRALSDLIILRMTNLSLEQGTSDASSIAYSALSLFLGPRFDDTRPHIGSENWRLNWPTETEASAQGHASTPKSDPSPCRGSRASRPAKRRSDKHMPQEGRAATRLSQRIPYVIY